jgi:uncharacterized membrane protein (DUF485 family)
VDVGEQGELHRRVRCAGAPRPDENCGIGPPRPERRDAKPTRNREKRQTCTPAATAARTICPRAIMDRTYPHHLRLSVNYRSMRDILSRVNRGPDLLCVAVQPIPPGGSMANASAARIERHDKGSHGRSARDVVGSPELKRLVARRWKVSLALLALLFATYYGFIILVATDRELVSRRIGEVTTLAIPLGVAAIAIAWALTALYVAWANRTYDPEVERLKGELER